MTKNFDIKARVHTLSGYSAHADQKDLVSFVKPMRYKSNHMRILHSDESARSALQEKYNQLLPGCEAVIGS